MGVSASLDDFAAVFGDVELQRLLLTSLTVCLLTCHPWICLTWQRLVPGCFKSAMIKTEALGPVSLKALSLKTKKEREREKQRERERERKIERERNRERERERERKIEREIERERDRERERERKIEREIERERERETEREREREIERSIGDGWMDREIDR